MPWHDGIDAREREGLGAEEEFINGFRCHCGGRFQELHTFKVDATCDNCGQLVNVKTSPDTEKWGNITISSRPLDGYPDDLLIVVRRALDKDEAGRWVGCFACDVQKDGPHKSTHKERATPFYKISLSTFVPLEALGLGNPMQ